MKRFLMMILAAAAVLGLAGCGDKDAQNIDEHKGRNVFDKYAFKHGTLRNR